MFGEKPKPVEGADEADCDKPQAGPTHKVEVGSTVKPSETKGSFKGSAPAKDAKPAVKAEEVKDDEAAPKTDEEKDEEKKQVKKESFTMNAFETLFKKTLTEEVGEETAPMAEEEISDMEEVVNDVEETDELDSEEEEGDLIADLKELQDKLADILTKLEDAVVDTEDETGEDEYSEEDFEDEFGEEEAEVKEALEKPKALAHAKGKALTSKKNKVGKVSPKGGKAQAGSVKNEPKPKALGDKIGHLQKGQTVHSTVTKGDFIK